MLGVKILYGPELLVNGDFANWTADDPDDWPLVGAEDAATYVTENPASHCQIVTAVNNIGISQNLIFTIGKNYRIEIITTAAASGALNIGTTATPSLFGTISTVDTHVFTGIADATNLRIARSGAADITIDTISAKEIL